MKKLWLFLATGFGLGYAPFASGTFGSLPGLALVWLINTRVAVPGQIACSLALTAFAIFVCDVAERHFGKKDDGRVVADEYMLFPICMIGLPITPLNLAICFLVARACDVIKPWPARGLQRVTGGLGIVIDDFFAQLYALAINHGIIWLLRNAS